jgi:hypothetical protein
MEQAAQAATAAKRDNNSLEHKKVKAFQAGAIARRKMRSGSACISDTRRVWSFCSNAAMVRL